MNAPDNISKLAPNEVLVFGSNLAGYHDGGVAKLALDKFGAIYGKGVGPQGQCYAIPTMGGLRQIYLYAGDFRDYAASHTTLRFYVTKLGLGIAGHSLEEIAPIFYQCSPNVVLPIEFDQFNARHQ